jgi:glucokinase
VTLKENLPKPEQVTQAGKDLKDPLALGVLNHILLEYTAKYLCDLSLMTLPLGGIYLTGSVFQLGMRFLFEDPT